jgi:hypothetical protein
VRYEGDGKGEERARKGEFVIENAATQANNLAIDA